MLPRCGLDRRIDEDGHNFFRSKDTHGGSQIATIGNKLPLSGASQIRFSVVMGLARRWRNGVVERRGTGEFL